LRKRPRLDSMLPVHERSGIVETNRNVVIASRGSRLALIQAEWVKSQIESAYSSLTVSIEEIKTTGDSILDTALDRIGGKGLFTKEIERALLDESADLAVHSMKDLPTELPDGLTLGAVTRREDPHDALVAGGPVNLDSLPEGARLGTGSLRRRAQALYVRPDLDVRDLRGNLDTRLRKLDRGDFDAMIVACAGLKRMGRAERITQVIPYSVMLPAAGQGALAIEVRCGDKLAGELTAVLNDPATEAAVTAERAMLARLEGGCHVPIGAIAEVDNGILRIKGVVASLDGAKVIRTEEESPLDKAADVGRRLAERLLAMGADRLLDEIG